MSIRKWIHNFGLFIVVGACLLYVGDKLDFIDFPRKWEAVLSLITFTGVFIFAGIGAYLEKKVSNK